MTPENILIIFALIFGFYAAWNIGANDVANAMGTSVGSHALTLRQAVLCAAIFEFLGAVLFGSNVSTTIERGIIIPEAFSSSPLILVVGMLAALLATGLWLQFASYCGLPVSTTHTIVGAIIGFGAIIGGITSVNWNNVAQIAVSWLASPLLGGIMSYLLFMVIRHQIFYAPSPLQAIRHRLPVLFGAVAFVLTLSMTYQIILPEASQITKIGIALIVAIIASQGAKWYATRLHIPEPHPDTEHTFDPQLIADVEKSKKQLQRLLATTRGEQRYHLSDIIQELDSFSFSMKKSNYLESSNTEFYWVERVFAILQITSACLMAFAHGSNDVSNAIGPMASIISTLNFQFGQGGTFPIWALILGGIGIVVGLATWGWRVIETIGKRITELTPSRGFAAEFGAAMTILLASRFGIPISTTHTLVGAVFGIGLAGGLGSLNLRTIHGILLSWIVTIPAGAILSIICYYVLSAIVPYVI